MRKSAKGRTWSVTLDVVGMQFRWTKDGRETLSRSVPFFVEFERQPDNPKDENAIKVNISSDFKLTKLRGMHLGYVRAPSAALLAPRLDNGTLEPVKLWVTEVNGEAGMATLEARFQDVIPSKRKSGRKSSLTSH